MTCPICGRVFEDDPIYEVIGAHPDADFSVAYHSRLRRFQDVGCEAIDQEHIS